MGVVSDRRARSAAKHMLGSPGRIVRHRGDGSPVFEVDGRQFSYRQHDGERYFRLLVTCSVCGAAQVTWRGQRITSVEDVASLDVGPLMCTGCAHDQVAGSENPNALRAKIAQDRERMSRQLGEK